MSHTYCLPNESGAVISYETDSNVVIIIGANGSGKSKLGAWIEKQDMEKVHRIGAQRDLNFQENIPLKGYEQAEDLVLYGTDDKSQQKGKCYRWKWGKSYTTKLMDDFDDVLAALIALRNKDNDEYVKKCKLLTKAERPDPPETAVDKLIKIWNMIFPQRSLRVEDAKILAIISSAEKVANEYNSTQMSDGERAVLYLAAQVLCVPEHKTLIIDEPEIHLHRSIMIRLWTALESCRPDCLFVYITHDTQFAAMHGNSEKIWIKAFDGNNWELEKIVGSELPEDLLLDILGSRKHILFVEGEKNSYDTQLYSALYPKCYVIPCGSCAQVIARTKAFRKSPTLHRWEAYGIIDRDYRSDSEIKKYAKDNIYTVAVAEVENLFLVKELVFLIAKHLEKEQDSVFCKVKEYIINDRFQGQIEKQICQSVVTELKYRLSCADLSNKSEEEVEKSLDKVLSSINYDEIKTTHEMKFRNILRSGDYNEVLKVFNHKSLSSSIGHFFDLDDKAYCSRVIAFLNGTLHDKIVEALSPYLPDEVPR